MGTLAMAIFVAFAALASGVVMNVVSSEIYDSSETWARRLLKLAVRNLPEDERARAEEEWAAHLNECRGKLTKLCVAIGFLRAARKIASDVGTQAVTTTGGAGRLNSYTKPGKPRLPPFRSRDVLRLATLAALQEVQAKFVMRLGDLLAVGLASAVESMLLRHKILAHAMVDAFRAAFRFLTALFRK